MSRLTQAGLLIVVATTGNACSDIPSTPGPLGLRNAAIAAPHSLRVWGDNKSHQKSDAPSGPIKAVASGSFQSIALKPDGTPVLWGTRPIIQGQPVGPGDIPAELENEKFITVSLGRDDAVFRRPDGTLRFFGRRLTSVPAGAYSSATLATGFGVAIDRFGSLTVWGPGAVNFGLVNAPTGGRFIDVSARVLYALALSEDGVLFGWGNGSAQGPDIFAGWAATADAKNFYLPGQTSTMIAAGNAHALAVRPDGTVAGWGDNSGGALDAPPHIRFKAVSAGWGFSIGLSVDGTLWGWGKPFALPNTTDAWTFASEGWTPYDNGKYYYVAGDRFKSIAAGAFHVMALTNAF